MSAKTGITNITIAMSIRTANPPISAGYIIALLTVRRRLSSFSSWFATRSSTTSRLPLLSPALTIDTNISLNTRGCLAIA